MVCSFIDRMRGPRIFGLALFDWAFSLLGAWAVGYFLLHLKGAVAWVLFIIFWILLGIFAHVATNTPTMLGYYLGLSVRPQIKKC